MREVTSPIESMSYESNKTKWLNRYPAISDLARKAKKRIPKVAWEYLESGTGDEELLKRNRAAFNEVKFLPQFCKGELQADCSTELLGQQYAAPIGVAPVGLSGLMWPKVASHLAASCNRFQIPMCLSTLATETPEEVGQHVGNMGWFQLYPPKDQDILESLLQRAKDSGYHTLVITADIPMPKFEGTNKACWYEYASEDYASYDLGGCFPPYLEYQNIIEWHPQLENCGALHQ